MGTPSLLFQSTEVQPAEVAARSDGGEVLTLRFLAIDGWFNHVSWQQVERVLVESAKMEETDSLAVEAADRKYRAVRRLHSKGHLYFEVSRCY